MSEDPADYKDDLSNAYLASDDLDFSEVSERANLRNNKEIYCRPGTGGIVVISNRAITMKIEALAGGVS